MRQDTARIQLVAVGLFVSASAVLGWGLGAGAYVPLAVFAVLCAVVLAITRPELALYLPIALALTVDGLTSAGLVPVGAVVIRDIVLVAIVLAVLIRAAVSGTRIRMPLLGPPVLLLLFVWGASAVVNGTAPLEAILAFRLYFKYALLYLAILAVEPAGSPIGGPVSVLVFGAYLQVPVVVLQFLGGLDRDARTGTLGFANTGVLAVWLLIIAGLLYRRATMASETPSAAVLVAPLSLLTPAALSEAKIAFAFAPVVAVWVTAATGALRRLSRAARVALVMSIGVALAFLGYQSLFSFQLTDAQSISRYVATTYSGGDAGVIRALPAAQYALNLVGRSPTAALVGYGPGAASERTLVGVSGGLVAANPGIYLALTSFSRVTLELGLAGWIALVVLAAATVRMGGVARRRGVGAAAQALVQTLGFTALAFIPLSLYANVWTAESLAVTFWVFAGVSERYLAQAA